ncbi:MAG: tripartite tricarboxylate transporter TctB family protein [Pseudomonadota bacterium]
MQVNDRFLGGLVIVAGVAVIAGTLGFRELPGQQFGSSFFPRLIGSAMILSGLALAMARTDTPWLAVSQMVQGAQGLKVASVFVAVLLWVFISPHLGFIATTALMITGLIVIAGGRVLSAALTGLGVAVLLHLIFSVLLRVPLPFGLVERVIT